MRYSVLAVFFFLLIAVIFLIHGLKTGFTAVSMILIGLCSLLVLGNLFLIWYDRREAKNKKK